jgi:hypothetical protein
MTDPKTLSPAAQAVRDAFFDSSDDFTASIAAAIRAAADQVVPSCSALPESGTKQLLIRQELLAIAAELAPPNWRRRTGGRQHHHGDHQ